MVHWYSWHNWKKETHTFWCWKTNTKIDPSKMAYNHIYNLENISYRWVLLPPSWASVKTTTTFTVCQIRKSKHKPISLADNLSLPKLSPWTKESIDCFEKLKHKMKYKIWLPLNKIRTKSCLCTFVHSVHNVNRDSNSTCFMVGGCFQLELNFTKF